MKMKIYYKQQTVQENITKIWQKVSITNLTGGTQDDQIYLVKIYSLFRYVVFHHKISFLLIVNFSK